MFWYGIYHQLKCNNYYTVNFEHADVNECINTRSSFECDCMSGIELQPDGKTCQGKN